MNLYQEVALSFKKIGDPCFIATKPIVGLIRKRLVVWLKKKHSDWRLVCRSNEGMENPWASLVCLLWILGVFAENFYQVFFFNFMKKDRFKIGLSYICMQYI